MEELKKLFFSLDRADSIRETLEASGEQIMSLSEFELNYAKKIDIHKNWNLNIARDHFRDTYHELIKAGGVDFILCPTYVSAAAEHGTAHYWLYTSIWNLPDQPGGVFPSGLKVDSNHDAVDQNFHPLMR